MKLESWGASLRTDNGLGNDALRAVAASPHMSASLAPSEPEGWTAEGY